MNKTIEQLEKELEDRKKEKYKQEWKEHLQETRTYLEGLIGKDLIRFTSNGSFVVFRVKDVKEAHTESEGFYGQFHPRRWLELDTEAWITANVPNDAGRVHRSSGTHARNLLVRKGKMKELISMPDTYLNSFDFTEFIYLPSEVSVFGKQSYEDKEPNFQRDLSNFLTFTYLAPEGMYDELLQIHLETHAKMISFWSKYKGSDWKKPDNSFGK